MQKPWCTGADSSRFGGVKICNSKQFGAQAIEVVIWEAVQKLLKDPERIFAEYNQRLKKLEQTPSDHTDAYIGKKRMKLEKSIEILIDAYTQEYIVKDEFEPRINSMRKKLKIIQEQQEQLIEEKNLTEDLELIIANLEEFAKGVTSKIDSLDWHSKRYMIRQVIKRIEIGESDINIVYRVPQLSHNHLVSSSQHCCNRMQGSYGDWG